MADDQGRGVESQGGRRRRRTAAERVEALQEQKRALEAELVKAKRQAERERRRADTREKIVAGATLKKLVEEEGNDEAAAVLRLVLAEISASERNVVVRAGIEAWLPARDAGPVAGGG